MCERISRFYYPGPLICTGDLVHTGWQTKGYIEEIVEPGSPVLTGGEPYRPGGVFLRDPAGIGLLLFEVPNVESERWSAWGKLSLIRRADPRVEEADE